MALALQAGVSCRHLSWLETGRANPSRAMVLRLAAQLDLAPRERNSLLAVAGYAPLYSEHALDAPARAGARRALQRLLDAHEPWPALAVDAQWRLVAHNRMLPWLLQDLPPGAHTCCSACNARPPPAAHRGYRPCTTNWPPCRCHPTTRAARPRSTTVTTAWPTPPAWPCPWCCTCARACCASWPR